MNPTVPSSEYIYAELHVVQVPVGGIRVVDLDVERWRQLPGASRALSKPRFAEKTSRIVGVQDWRHEFQQLSSGRVAYDAMPCATDPGMEPALMEHQLKALLSSMSGKSCTCQLALCQCACPV
jgi:hypothetical protein